MFSLWELFRCTFWNEVNGIAFGWTGFWIPSP